MMQEDWRPTPLDVGAAERLAAACGLSRVAARLLASRGISTVEGANQFLHPARGGLHDPFQMRGMEAAVGTLLSACRKQRRIVVFGDYDVDGVTAVAQLRAVLRRLGSDAVPFIPHRIRDGYGLKPETLRRVLSEHRPDVLITVDCGITAIEAVREATEAGVEVVITDHHLPPENLPRGTAVLNPKQAGCGYPFKELCGSGIAFKIAQALIDAASLTLSEESLLKLAALGTVADMVPLLGENRVIVSLGLAALAEARAPGLAALLREAQVIGRAPDAEEVGYRIAPRINAAGRIDTAELALSLFEERDREKASGIARELSRRNSERQSLERRVVSEVEQRLERTFDAQRDAVIIESSPDWHRGVLGIAASRIARRYHRPTLLFAQEGSRTVGSGRSVPGISLHALLSEVAEEFIEFGGHDQAVGGAVASASFGQLCERVRALFSARLTEEDRRPAIFIDAEIGLEEVGVRLLSELERLEPWGQGNPRPIFALPETAAGGRFLPIGERGRRGAVRGPNGPVRAVAWNLAEQIDAWAASGQPRPLAVHLRTDRRTGLPELEVVSVGAAENAAT
jgi:single-stranded-DNA-specific exonuclease